MEKQKSVIRKARLLALKAVLGTAVLSCGLCRFAWADEVPLTGWIAGGPGTYVYTSPEIDLSLSSSGSTETQFSSAGITFTASGTYPSFGVISTGAGSSSVRVPFYATVTITPPPYAFAGVTCNAANGAQWTFGNGVTGTFTTRATYGVDCSATMGFSFQGIVTSISLLPPFDLSVSNPQIPSS